MFLRMDPNCILYIYKLITAMPKGCHRGRTDSRERMRCVKFSVNFVISTIQHNVSLYEYRQVIGHGRR